MKEGAPADRLEYAGNEEPVLQEIAPRCRQPLELGGPAAIELLEISGGVVGQHLGPVRIGFAGDAGVDVLKGLVDPV